VFISAPLWQQSHYTYAMSAAVDCQLSAVGVGFFTCNYLAIRLKASFFGHFSLGNPIWVIKKMSEKGLTKMDKQ